MTFASAPNPSTGVAQQSEHRISVLVVAAHDAVRSALATLIAAQRDMRVVASAASAREALVAAQCDRPAVAIIDVELADHDGLWLTSRLKRLEHAPRVLLISSYADVALVPQARIAGADGILNMGVLGDRIVQAVHTVSRGDPDLPVCTGTVAQCTTASLHPYRKSIERGAGRRHRQPPSAVPTRCG